MKRRVSLETRLRTLRDGFDESFAAPIVEERGATCNFLAIRLGKKTHALPLHDISGLFAHRSVTPLPTTEPALLGLANFRGTIAPVFDLHLLLGLKAAEHAAWFAIAAAAPVAFAFERFEGHLCIPEEDIVMADASDGKGDQAQQSVRANGILRPVVHLPSIVTAIGKSMSAA